MNVGEVNVSVEIDKVETIGLDVEWKNQNDLNADHNTMNYTRTNKCNDL